MEPKTDPFFSPTPSHLSPLILACTGHRPDKLGGHSAELDEKLEFLASIVLQRLVPDQVLTGMALGWDQAIARAAFKLTIPYIAVVPFPNQPSFWPPEAIKSYRHLLNRASTVKMIGQDYSPQVMQQRNEWLVDNSEGLIALHSGAPGGTANCIRYARAKRKKIYNYWKAWETI